MQTVILTGGTGLIGTSLSGLLVSKGYRVIILTRKPKQSTGNILYAAWDIKHSDADKEAFSNADHIIHLAGAGIADKRWTVKRKNEIVNSRVEGSRLVIKMLKETVNKVQTVVSASGMGWYGPDPENSTRAFVETDPSSTDFLGETCRLWEESIQPVTALGKRLVILRTSLVLSKDGGAFPEFKKPMKAGVATILGSGKQVISWIHIDDICRMYVAAIENLSMHGAYNAAAPMTITNKTLTLQIARSMKRPFIPVHIPAFILKTFLGEMSIEVLKSTTIDDTRIRNTGFVFVYPTFESALNVLR